MLCSKQAAHPALVIVRSHWGNSHRGAAARQSQHSEYGRPLLLALVAFPHAVHAMALVAALFAVAHNV